MRNWIRNAANAARARVRRKSFFHLHLVSDSTGETLTTAGRAAASQYGQWQALEHLTSMVRSRDKLDKALAGVEQSPGIVLYTLVDPELAGHLRARCAQLGVTCIDVLDPVLQAFESFLGETSSGRMGAQHELDDSYFQRLDAIKFAMAHDDGNLPADLDEADIVLVGISRTSKTPTSIHLAQRGLKVVNIPIVPGVDLPPSLQDVKRALVVALVASAERIRQVRENRLLAFGQDIASDTYVDRAAIAAELAWTRRLCQTNDWPMIDVTRRSVEETSAAIHALHRAAHPTQHAPALPVDGAPASDAKEEPETARPLDARPTRSHPQAGDHQP